MPNPSENNAAIIHTQKLLQQLRENYLAELPDRINELEQRALSLKSANDVLQSCRRGVVDIQRENRPTACRLLNGVIRTNISPLNQSEVHHANRQHP